MNIPVYKRKPIEIAQSQYSKEYTPTLKRSIGGLIRTGLLAKRDIKALRTITEDEPSDKAPDWNSGAFSRSIDPFVEPMKDLNFPEEK